MPNATTQPTGVWPNKAQYMAHLGKPMGSMLCEPGLPWALLPARGTKVLVCGGHLGPLCYGHNKRAYHRNGALV